MAQSAFLRMQGTIEDVLDGPGSYREMGRRTSVNGVEEVGALLLLLDVCVDEERVHLGVDVLHHDLKSVETACLWYLHLSTEALNKVFIDNTI